MAGPVKRNWARRFVCLGLRASGLLVGVAAIVGPQIGLGAGPDFVIYRLIGVPRRETLIGGLLLVLASFLPLLFRVSVVALHHFLCIAKVTARPVLGATYHLSGEIALALRSYSIAVASALRSFSAQIAMALRSHITACSASLYRAVRTAAVDIVASCVRTDRSRRPPIQTLGLQLCLVASVALLAFWINRGNLLGYIDGEYLLTLSKNEKAFGARGFFLSSNPLQGLGDLWYFANSHWIPELAVARLFSDPDWQRVIVHVVAAVDLFAVAGGLAAWLGLSPGRIAAAGWLSALLIAPLTYPALIYNITPDAPQLASFCLMSLAAVPIWAGVGTGPLMWDGCRFVLLALLFWLQFIAFGLFVALAYPFIAVAGAIFWLASWPNKKEFWRKAAVGALLGVFLALSGLPQILAGVVFDTAFRLFGDQLAGPEHVIGDTTVLLRTDEPVALAVAALAVVGAAICAIYGRNRIRVFAIATLIYVAAILGLSALYLCIGISDARPIYYEYVLWPVYPAFAICALFGCYETLAARLQLVRVGHRAKEVMTRCNWIVLPLLATAVLHGPGVLRGLRSDRPHIYPPTPTVLTQYLQQEVGLDPGSSFRGRVATMTGQAFPRGAGWEKMFTLDLDLIRRIGNEHRNIGLWYYNIPTLFEFNHTVPPLLYAVVVRYLTYDDPQFRTVLNMRRPDIGILRLLGVRYVIDDGPPPSDERLRRVRELAVPDDSRILAIDEIQDPNLGVSPTKLIGLDAKRGSIDQLDDIKTDFANVAIFPGANPGSLVAAQNINVTVDRNDIRVTAQSTGRSLIVIPFQYSHCVEVLPNAGDPHPELHRADILLSGVLFEKSLDVRLRYRQGPFVAPSCRLKDLSEELALLSPARPAETTRKDDQARSVLPQR